VEAVLGEHRDAVGTRVDLVLVQPDSDGDPSGTASWTRGRGIDRHHHLRRARAEDADRICRVLRNQAVVLVLSGGGARGMAEIGVVRAMQELGIPIDAVAGTSAGALVAGAVARGWGWQRIAATVRAGVAEGKSLIDLTFPALSLASGARVTERLRAAAGTIDIEDLLIDYFCVSTNLTRKEPRVHVSGPAWRAVRASLAIPGVFPPVPDGDDVLVDGGMLENYPVRRMRLRHPRSTVVGVDVGSRRDLSARDLPDTGVVSGWDLLRARFDRSRNDGSLSMVKVLAGLTELGVRDPEGPDLADVTVEPPVLDLPILDFSRFDEAVERGYQEGRSVLEAWWTSQPGRSE
jgi:predicted acylesterase/phospholipase RssA